MNSPTNRVEVNTYYSRGELSYMGEPQLIYALVEVAPVNEPLNTASAPLNICLVLDRSTSMQGARMDQVKESAIELVRHLRPQDVLSIVTFSDRAEVVISGANQQDRNEVETIIRMLRTGGGTEIYYGLEAGLAEIRRHHRTASINHLILITDGQTYGDEDSCYALADQAAALGVSLTGLGIGDQWNDVFMDTLAARTGGTSLYLSGPADLERLLRNKFQTLILSFAENVILDLKSGPAVDLQYVFRLEPDPSDLAGLPPFHLGRVPRDAKLSFLLEFVVDSIPSGQQSVGLAEGYLEMEFLDQMLTTTYSLSFARSVSNLPGLDPPPANIVQAMSRLTLYRMQEKTRKDILAGDYARATRRMHHLATHLLARGDHDLARTVLLEAERVRQKQHISAEGEKQIKYGTRSLLMPNARDK